MIKNILIYYDDMDSSLLEDWALYQVDTDITDVDYLLDLLISICKYQDTNSEMLAELNDPNSGMKELCDGYSFDFSDLCDIEEEIDELDGDYDFYEELLKRLGYSYDEEYRFSDLQDEYGSIYDD